MATDRKTLVSFIARYHGDKNYAREVNANPTEAMRKAGIDVPEGKQVKLVQDTSDTAHLVLPALADGVELNEDELLSIYAGDPPGATAGWPNCCDGQG